MVVLELAYDESKLINLGHLKDALEAVKEHIPEDTDIKVTQTLVSDSVERPILTAPTAQSATTTTTSAFSTNVKVNASTGTLTATKFVGDGSGLNVGSTSGNAVYTTTSGKLTSGSLSTSDPSASGNTTSFIDTISQDAKGKITATKKTVPDMGAATSSAAGTKGLVQATAGSQTKFLRGDATWQTVVTTETQLSKGTPTGSGNAVTDINVSDHQITLVKGTTFATKAELDALGNPMNFKGTVGTGGTVTTLPADAKIGDTYKVITAGTYGGNVCKVGDTLICTVAGSSQTWALIPSGDEPEGTVTNIATGSGLTGGPITSTGTISHADTSSQSSMTTGGRTYVNSITLDDFGHVTALGTGTETDQTIGNKALKIASDSGTATQAITMNESSADKTLTVKGDGTYLKGAVSGSAGAVTVTITPEDSGVIANTYGPSADVTGSNNTTVKIPEITVDAKGRVTSITERTLTNVDHTYTIPTVGDKVLKLASDSGTATTAINVNENSSDRTATIKGDGTYITGAVSGSANAPIVTLSHAASGTAGSTSPSSSQTPGYGDTFNIPVVSYDAAGHITSTSTTTVKIPDSDNVDTKNTAGSNNDTAKMYLVGAKSQTTGTNGVQTYSNSAVYATNGIVTATGFSGSGSDINVGSTADYAVYTTTSGKLTSGSLATSDPTASGNTASFIDSISQDSKGQITATKKTVVPPTIGFGYGTCATDAATVAKTATLTGYELVAGGIVSIKFTYAVPASATLSINSQTAKAIQYNGSAITAGIIQAGDLVTFIYDGSYYHVIGILQENKIIFSSASLTLATSRWSSSGDTTYPYKAVINMPGVTENFLPVVQFRDSDTLLYDFSPVATSGSGTITIMCKTAPTTSVVIPQIICYRGQGVTLS